MGQQITTIAQCSIDSLLRLSLLVMFLGDVTLTEKCLYTHHSCARLVCDMLFCILSIYLLVVVVVVMDDDEEP